MIVVCSTLVVRGQTNSITVTPAALSIQYQIGSATLPAAQTLQVQTAPKGLNFAVSISGSPFNAAWLLVSASVGTSPASVKVTSNPTGLPAGSYVGTLTFTATAGAQTLTQRVTVTLLVASAPATISVTPASLNFAYITGNPIPSQSLASAFILSSSGAPLSATVAASGAPWLKVTPGGDISLIGLLNTISVTVDPTGLPPKVYSGTIKISAAAAVNKTLTVAVTLTVNAAIPRTFGTWPAGVIQGSAQTIATIDGSSFFSNSTVAATGFTPAATITVNDGSSTASETFLIPVYQASSTKLRLAVGSPLPSGTVGAAYSQTLAAAGGTPPYSYGIIAGLPPGGLAISGSAIAGTPSNAGTFLFTVQVTDSVTPPVQAYSQVKLTIYPTGATALRITVAPAPLPLGTVGAIYASQSLTVTGGTGGPYVWSQTNLPAGMTLSAPGVLAGTPSTDGGGGPLAATVVSDAALLATIPVVDLAAAGVLRMAVTTPGPGGGTSNEAQFQIFGPAPQITAIVNSASFQQGTLAPGDLIAIFGFGLGPATLTIFDPSVPPIPTSLPGVAPSTSVTINGTPAPVLYTSSTQATVIVPYSVSGMTAQVIVTYGGLVSQPVTVAVAPADPALYSLASSGQGQGAILNFNSVTGDYTINSTANPASRGSTVILYMTGAGTTTSAVYNQLIPLAPPVTPILTPAVTIGGQSATVQAAQAPPGSVPGLIQLNVTVPATLSAGAALPVVVTVGGVPSPSGLTMAVR